MEHAKYQFAQWLERYGLDKADRNNESHMMLDETTIYSDGSIKDTSTNATYAQLYISFEVFQEACQRIKDQYYPNGAVCYDNFMHYWAHNGEYNWIGNRSEYTDKHADDGVEFLTYTYASVDFWNYYTLDANQEYKIPTEHPVTIDGYKKPVIW